MRIYHSRCTVSILAFFLSLGSCCVGEAPGESRRWPTADGRFNVVATLVEPPAAGAKKISLRRKDTGATIEVPMSLLSQTDQDYVKELIARETAPSSTKPTNASPPPASQPIFDSPEKLADALITGLSQRSSREFAKCFATADDSAAALKASELTGDILEAELRNGKSHFAELRRELPKVHGLLRASAAKANIEFKAGSVVDVQVAKKSRKGIESFDQLEITFKQPKNRLAMLTMDDGFRSARGWLVSNKNVRLELLAGDTKVPDTSKWDVSGGRQVVIPRTKLRIHVPGKQEPVIQSAEIDTDEGKVTADILVNRFPGLEYVVLVIDYKRARGGRRSDATDEERVEGGLAGGAAAIADATIVEKYSAPQYAVGATAGQLLLVPGKRGMPDKNVMLFVNVRDAVLKSYQATYDARVPKDVQARIRKLLESMVR